MAASFTDEKAQESLHENIEDDSPAAIEYRKKEAKLLRKLDCFIAPVMMLLMLISYLDRGNIGFAATQGMIDDIGLRGSQLNTAVSIFYIFYILAEFPSSILVKRLQFNRVIPTITFCWGLVCMCTGLIHGFPSLIVTRILLGFFEGYELATRIAFLFIASALSGAFGSLLAWAILYMDGTAGLPGWRWLYILEGIITIIWAAICIFVVPKNYETAYFLNEEDKAIMRQRAEIMEAYSGGPGHYTMKDIKEAARDVKTWVHGVIQIAVVTILYGFGTFLPIIIKNGFHYSTVQAQYLVIPACFLCTGTNIAWLSGNCAPDGKRAASLGILLTLTNIGGVASGQIYQTKAAPKYTSGHAWSLGCLAFAWCGWWIVRAIYIRREKGKDKALAEGIVVEAEGYTDRAPDFRYQFGELEFQGTYR
ncbi:MFS general substrate transporter [Acephala macrosclerotiorum]|nr:MFS general substrate transporter [Acephala macrosclerotiorum]